MKKILIVDDEDSIVFSLKSYLEKSYHVDTASSGAEALGMIDKNHGKYDLILCDLEMNDINGAQLYLQATEKYKQLSKRIVFMTGGQFGGYLEAFGLDTQNPCLQKPFDYKVLGKVVADLMK